MGRLQGCSAIDGIAHDRTQLGNAGIGIIARLRDKFLERAAGVGRCATKEPELALGFLQMATEALEVLLHEFGTLREQDGAQHAEQAIDQTVKGPKNPRIGFHGASVRGIGIDARRRKRGETIPQLSVPPNMPRETEGFGVPQWTPFELMTRCELLF
jgi:hypothetical protein